MTDGPSTVVVRLPDRDITLSGDTTEAEIGRDPAATIWSDHPLVSRIHARVRREGSSWVVEDAGSSNGTFHDGERVSRVVVDDEVVLMLGDPDAGLRMTFLARVPPVASEPPPLPPAPPTQHASSPNDASKAPAPLGVGALSAIHQMGERTRIGRDPGNDVVLPGDLLVSRHHAELTRHPDVGIELVDLDSHNGTFVNGRRVRRVRLDQLDVVAIGHHRFRLVGDQLEEYVEAGDVAYEARGLTVTTPAGQVLLDDVSIALSGSSLLAVVGPSGAGKSTLLGALTGFKPAREGRVVYGGQDLYTEYDQLAQRIGFVPQDDILHVELTVQQALEYAAELRFSADVSAEERAARVQEVIGELGLSHRADVQVARLSGGQRKRVSVAMELLTRPSLLFLDEPTSGLDPGIERNVMELLRGLADGGRTVIVVTHTVQSLRLCDRVLVLAPGGSVAYFGPPQLAPAYFGCEDYEEIFQLLGTDTGTSWKDRFRSHADYEQYVQGPLAVAVTPPPSFAADREAAPTGRRGSWLRQFSTLTRRYTSVIAADRKTAITLLLQGPLLGGLMLWTLPPGELSLPPAGEFRLVSRASLVLFNLIVGATYLGAANAAREIVKELPLLRRERAVGLSLSAYVASKASVLSALTIAQAVVFTIVATARQDGPTDALVAGSPILELSIVVALTGLAAMALGLVLSSVVPTVDRAMTLLPVVLILQLTLASGGLFPELVDKPILKQTTYAAGPQWGFTAAAATVDLNRLQPLNAVGQDNPTVDLRDPNGLVNGILDARVGDPLLNHEPRRWWTAVIALLGLTVAGLIVSYLALRRLDPGGGT